MIEPAYVRLRRGEYRSRTRKLFTWTANVQPSWLKCGEKYEKFQVSRFKVSPAFAALRHGGVGKFQDSRFKISVSSAQGRGGSTPYGGTSASHALQCKRAGFIGIRRKPLILSAFINFYQVLTTKKRCYGVGNPKTEAAKSERGPESEGRIAETSPETSQRFGEDKDGKGFKPNLCPAPIFGFALPVHGSNGRLAKGTKMRRIGNLRFQIGKEVLTHHGAGRVGKMGGMARDGRPVLADGHRHQNSPGENDSSPRRLQIKTLLEDTLFQK
jgi:hypothetical protein